LRAKFSIRQAERHDTVSRFTLHRRSRNFFIYTDRRRLRVLRRLDGNEKARELNRMKEAADYTRQARQSLRTVAIIGTK
jgi:hypothetical protein